MPGTIIVTGAAGCLGLAVAETVLNRNESYNCLFTVRDKDAARAKPLHDLIASSSNNNEASTPEIDLSRLDSIRAFASNLNRKVSSGELPPIKALILNAAFFMEKGSLQFTQDDKDVKGFEMHFAVNYLANFLLTLLLLESMDKEHGRIVYVSSWKHDPTLKANQGH
jgi:NAD(P)-dependent dehydrogenase (short-subunit alcohol dehydrogenase family)